MMPVGVGSMIYQIPIEGGFGRFEAPEDMYISAIRLRTIPAGLRAHLTIRLTSKSNNMRSTFFRGHLHALLPNVWEELRAGGHCAKGDVVEVFGGNADGSIDIRGNIADRGES